MFLSQKYLNANSAEAYQKLAEVLKQKGNLEEAAFCYRQAIAINASTSETDGKSQEPGQLLELTKSSNLASQPQPVHGLTNNSQTLALPVEAAQVYLEQAEAYCIQQKWEQAIAACKQALKIAPKMAEVYKIWGNTLQRMGQGIEALGYYAKALAIQPNLAEVYANIGTIHAKQEQWRRAIDYYQKAIAINPKFAGAYRNLAKIWTQVKQPRKAAECAYQALCLEPDLVTPEEHFNFGKELWQQDLRSEAIACYRRAIEFNPNFVEAYEKLADALGKQGEWKQSNAYYIRAIQLNAARAKAGSRNQEEVNSIPNSQSHLHQLNGTTKVQKLLNPSTQEEKQLMPASERRVESVIQRYIKAAKAQPDSAEVHANLGSLYAQQQQWQQAIACYQKALQLNPKLAAVYSNLAKVLNQMGKTEAALQSLYKALTLEPNRGKAEKHCQLGNALWQQGKLEQAVVCYRRAIQLQPSLLEAYHRLGEVLVQQGQLQEAIAYYQKALLLNPKLVAVHRNLARIFIKIGKREEAADHWYQALTLEPNSVKAEQHFHLGNTLLEQGKADQAINCYRRSIELKPDFAAAYLNLGEVLSKQGQEEKAIALYQQAVARKIENADLYYRLGQALVAQEKWQEVTACYQKIIELQPNQWQAYYDLGIVFRQQKRWQEAIIAFRHAIELNPNSSWSHNGLGEAFLRLGRWKESVASYCRAIELNSDFAWSHYNLGEALVELEHWDEAAVAYQSALELQPDLPKLHQKLGDIFSQRVRGDMEATLNYYRQEIEQNPEDIHLYHKAIAIDKNNIEFYVGLGNSLTKQNFFDKAIVAYQMALQIQPRNIEVSLKLRDLLLKQNPHLDEEEIISNLLKGNFQEIKVDTQQANLIPLSRQEVYHVIKNSGLFNENYYSQNNPDVVQAGLDLLGHYLELGALEGRNPHPLFDTSYYLDHNRDVKESGLNPLYHYLEFGVAEGRDPHPLFDTSYYLEHNRDVKESGLNPLQHYLEFNTSQVREFNPLFSISNYLEKNPEVEILGLNPLLHYLEKQDSSQRFLYWPWQCLDCTISSQRGHYNLLVFSHDASRTGGPRVLLAFLKELKKSGNLRDINLWIVIDREGEIEEEFQECGLTITLSRLAELSEGDYEQVLRDFLTSFQEYTGNGTVLINTSAISHINSVCHQLRLPVLSWIHELPVTIDTYCGGRKSFQKILDSSRKIVCVSNFVKSSLIKYAQQEAQSDKFTTIYASPPMVEECDRFPTSEAYRREIEAEYSLPDDSFIVMGCGTVMPRKGCDVFVQVANYLINKCNLTNVFFLWIGEIFANEYIQWLEHDIQTLGLEGQVVFAGKRTNPSYYMKGADVFILTSKEDPFPLVNLEAMYYGLPAISFRGGGGAPEIYDGERRGIAVEYLNVAEMAMAIIKLKENPQLRREIALEAQNYIREELNWSNFVGNFMQLIRDDFDYHPQQELKITIIIPNYNHQKFIEERIASIVNQTVKPDEIIFLDDNSSDRSAEIAVQLLSKTDIPHKIIINEQNTGSPFKQWVKGIEAASGDLIWIAESDDSCKFNLIEKLKPQFFDPDVVLAYCQSAPMGENGQIFQDNYHFYTNDICNERWSKYHKDEGVKEIAQSLCLKNTIPNASAVIFRKEALTQDCLEHIKDFRFVGDWLLYVSLLKKGKVAFVPNSLNYHRRHGGTVTSKVEKEDKHAQEVLELKCYIFSHPFVSANSISESLGRTIDDYYSLDKRHNLGRVAFTKNPSFEALLATIHSDFNQKYFSSRSSSPGILFLIGDADFGGGQIAAIRLANELAKNYRVFLCNARPGLGNDDLIGLIDSRIVFIEGTLKPTVWSNNKEQRMRVLRDLIEFHHIDVLFSHIWWADRFAYEVNQELNLPWYIQMHGCYEALADHPDWDSDFLKLIEPMMNSASGVGYLTSKNLKVFDKLNLTPPKQMAQFFNGFDRTTVDFTAAESQLIKRGVDDFIFCLCSRAIPEKGWKEAIEAIIAINQLPLAQRNHKTARLILIGDSDYAKTLRSKYGDASEITFMGQQKQPTSFYAQCDVGLLPSRFKSESVPCTVIEYLACDLPVIATQIGSIPEMISLDGDDAGLLVSISEDLHIEVTELQAMMLTYITDEQLYLEHKSNASKIFNSLFDIKNIANSYIEFFNCKYLQQIS